MDTDSTIAELRQKIEALEQENRTLREFNDTFASLYEAMVEGVCLHEVIRDADGTPTDYRILDVNPAYEKMIGLNRDNAVGQRASRLYGTGEAPYLDLYAQVAGTGRPASFETYFAPMNKHFSISVISPAPEVFATIFFDITDRKTAELELAQIFSMSLSLICIADIDTASFTKVNPAFTEVLGHSESELLGKPFLSFVHPDDLQGTIDIIEQSLKKGRKVDHFQNRYRCRDGSYRWLDWVSHPDPELGITYAVAHDITVLREAKQSLEQSENRIRNLLENAPDAFFVNRRDGRLTMVNKQACKSLGYTREELLKMSVSDIDIAADPARSVNIWKHVLDGASVTFEGRHRRKDGTTFPVEVKISAFSQGETPLIFGFARDISDRERHNKEWEKLQKQLSQAQKMEALGTLAGGIAHDFNNLLMGVMGRSSLLAQDMSGNHAQLEHIQGIDACVKSAMNLTKQLLGLARGGKYEVQATDANQLTGDTLDMFSRTRKEVLVHTTFAPDLDAVTVDKTQISQVLLNIFINAWQAMPAGGDLFVETQNFVIESDQAAAVQTTPGRYVKISITDSGIGMPQEIQMRIFDPFFTTKEKGRGTGLGLASAYGIVKNHGGLITVYSEPGHGSTFNIYLPAATDTPKVAEEKDHQPITGTGTILLVDDEPNILEVGRLMLDRLGYTVFTAANGPEALKLFRELHENIQAIILDMVMPGLGGSETFDALREIDPACRVILSSGYSINGQASAILSRGCDGFIQKPFNLTQLSEKVHAVLAADRGRLPADG